MLTEIRDSIPASSSPRQQFVARIGQNHPICREHYRLALRLDRFPVTEPGQFIQVACRDTNQNYSPDDIIDWQPGQRVQLHGQELLSPLAFLRRPFSLAGRRDTRDGVELEIIHRVVGVGTDWLSRLKVGDSVNIVGPLGNRFQLPPEDHTAVLVGGGVGIPPMLYLAQKLKGHKTVAFCGATTRDLLALTTTGESDPLGIVPKPCIAEFAEQGVSAIVTTDDGSYGFRGFITQALEKWLDAAGSKQQAAGSGSNVLPAARCPLPAVIYTCGPEPMMKRVAEIAISRNIPCQIAVERAMACGMGTCQSCCIRVKKPDPSQPPLTGKEWCWRLACTDGPIFNAADLLW